MKGLMRGDNRGVTIIFAQFQRRTIRVTACSCVRLSPLVLDC